MFNSPSKLLLTMILLLAFVGQSMASHFVMPIDEHSRLQTETQEQVPVSAHDNSDTSDTSGSVEDDECCEVECCESECICPANACASMVYLDTSLLFSGGELLSEPLLLAATKGTYYFSTPLYRPPIFTS